MAEVELVPMTDQERGDWMAADLDKYTASRVRAGETPEDPDSRGAGLGQATLAAAEDLALEQGATQLTLNVFGDNTVARNLYRSAGFTEVAVTMSKQLEPRR